jgi:rod shape-determining protein MreC
MKYLFGTAKVVSNSIARQDNFFVIDKGTADGIEENMAVLSPEGAVAGYVRRHSDHYAVCMSVLNGSFSIGGRLKGSEYFGSVYWDGTDPREMTMVDIPRYADVKRGDSVLSAYSLRFPPDCFIGTVASVSESPDGIYHVIKIRLGAKMNALSDVLLVKYTDYEELETLAGEHFSDADKKKK